MLPCNNPLHAAIMPAAPPGTYVPKYVAAVISLNATLLHLAKLPSGRLPVLSSSMAIFFLGGGVSAAIGATLEAYYDDVQHGAAWSAMLVFVELAALGAWCAAFELLFMGSSCRKVTSPLGILSGLALLTLSLDLVFHAPEVQRFDLAFELAAPGGTVLLVGALILACRECALRTGCVLVALGVAVTAVGYAVDAAWLGPACAPPSPNATEGAIAGTCPLPAWISPDGVYHIALDLSYLLIACGSVRIHNIERARLLRETASAATRLLSVQVYER